MTQEADRALVDLVCSGEPFGLARAAFHHAVAGIEQAQGQAKPLGTLDRIRLEFAAVRRIAAALGVGIAVDSHRPWEDCTIMERKCDHCGKPYNGPGVYCSLACVEADGNG